jgi:hypothetical protein
MHSLTFPSYAAVLDPVTGLGVLLLPDRLAEECSTDSLLDGSDLRTNAWLNEDEYVLVMRQLGSIGWALPEDEEGRPTWFDAGPTDCCGRTMINLHGLDATDPDRGLQKLINSCRQIQDLAAAACCGEREVAESLADPAWVG